jgi:alkanesulfonate monooxygenase SsuD/methylene tetrahydromethanopterin reductase-like flavin-dependent oxidoreductase (luciferase family)
VTGSSDAGVKLGALCWNQYTDWPSLLDAGRRAEALGFDTLWTWDHLYPIVGNPAGPIFEGWLTLTAWAQATERIRIGLMVGANTFREPTLTAKMATGTDLQTVVRDGTEIGCGDRYARHGGRALTRHVPSPPAESEIVARATT